MDHRNQILHSGADPVGIDPSSESTPRGQLSGDPRPKVDLHGPSCGSTRSGSQYNSRSTRGGSHGSTPCDWVDPIVGRLTMGRLSGLTFSAIFLSKWSTFLWVRLLGRPREGIGRPTATHWVDSSWVDLFLGRPVLGRNVWADMGR